MNWDVTTMVAKIWESWVAGGWTMIPIGMVAIGLYVSGLRLLMSLNRRALGTATDEELRVWVATPDRAPSEIREVLRYTQDDVKSIDEAASRFVEVEASRIPDLDRRLSSLNVLVGAAPLLGLLGTVLGMLVTFRAIATGGGKMVDAMAKGISEALITTEMGLLVALPGMVIAYMIRRKRNEYVSLLARLESVTLRALRPRLHGMTRVFVRSKVRSAEEVAAAHTGIAAEGLGGADGNRYTIPERSNPCGETSGWNSVSGIGGEALPSVS